LKHIQFLRHFVVHFLKEEDIFFMKRRYHFYYLTSRLWELKKDCQQIPCTTIHFMYQSLFEEFVLQKFSVIIHLCSKITMFSFTPNLFEFKKSRRWQLKPLNLEGKWLNKRTLPFIYDVTFSANEVNEANKNARHGLINLNLKAKCPRVKCQKIRKNLKAKYTWIEGQIMSKYF
jgi:hypothetical protein